jgi:hypothetical protein
MCSLKKNGDGTVDVIFVGHRIIGVVAGFGDGRNPYNTFRR